MPRHHREDAAEVRAVSAPRALLAGIVDYAGLFPPAGLDMATAVRNYADYRAGDDAWLLGRFVVPVGRIDELDAALTSAGCDTSSPWRLAGLVGSEVERDADRAREHNARPLPATIIDSLEGRAASPDAIQRLASAARSGEFAVFAEIPLDEDPDPFVAAMANAAVSAKIRTGGVTADAFPAPRAVLRALRCCFDRGVPVKATAGLHHPLRGEYPLTYDPAAPRGTMFGFLNVFLAAAFLRQGLGDDEALRLLEERDPRAFELCDETVRWRGYALTAAQMRDARDAGARSFGSCSFREPVDDLRALTWLPT
jgi:hypothetical protein